MTTLEPMSTTLRRSDSETPLDEAQMAAAAFLARYSARTLDAYRHDLRAFFQWATDSHLVVLRATRPHIELYRAAMEERGLAASTIDRRLSTVCGFYRFAHIDGRIPSRPTGTSGTGHSGVRSRITRAGRLLGSCGMREPHRGSSGPVRMGHRP
jgi:hypothetical protein